MHVCNCGYFPRRSPCVSAYIKIHLYTHILKFDNKNELIHIRLDQYMYTCTLMILYIYLYIQININIYISHVHLHAGCGETSLFEFGQSLPQSCLGSMMRWRDWKLKSKLKGNASPRLSPLYCCISYYYYYY